MERPSGVAVDEESSGARPGDIFGNKIFGNKFGQAEIENFGLTALGDEDVGGLDVPMDDTSGVGNVEGIGNLNPEVEDLFDRQRLAVDVLTQGFAVDELHGDKGDMILFANVVDRADARVVEGRSGVGFAAKTLQSLGVLGHAVGKKFQGDSAIESGVQGLVDHTHSASTEFLQNAKVRNGTVNHEGARAPRSRRCR